MAPRGEDTGAGRASIVLLACNEAGYLNLMHIASRAWLDPAPGDAPHAALARWRAARAASSRLPAARPGRSTAPSPRRGPSRPCAGPKSSKRCFPDRLYVEIQRHGLASERETEPRLIDLAYRRSLPLVATNEAYFADAADYEAHDALICIAEGAIIGEGARRQLSPEHRFKTRAEMLDAVFGSAGGDAQLGRDRAALRLPAADPQAAAAALLRERRARRGGRPAAPRG